MFKVIVEYLDRRLKSKLPELAIDFLDENRMGWAHGDMVTDVGQGGKDWGGKDLSVFWNTAQEDSLGTRYQEEGGKGGEGRTYLVKVSGVLMVDFVEARRSTFQEGIEGFCLNILLKRSVVER